MNLSLSRAGATLLAIALATGCSNDPVMPPEEPIGSWLEPVPGQPGEVQGFTLHGDGTAESINTATLQHAHWRLEGHVLVLRASPSATASPPTSRNATRWRWIRAACAWSMPTARCASTRSRKGCKAAERFARTPERLATTPERFARTPERLATTPERLARTPERLARTPERSAKTSERLARTSERLAKTPERLARTPERLAKTPERLAKTPERFATTL
jgi:hypothetical protein